MRATSILPFPTSMALTDELRDKAQIFSDSSNVMYETVSSLAGMLDFIDRILIDAPDMTLEFRDSLHNAVRGCKLLANSAVTEDGFNAILFLRDIASGNVASFTNGGGNMLMHTSEAR